MDSLITAAARALAAGDPLGALKRVALRNDAPALALRGIAMAQLGEFARARELVRSAARAFGPKEHVARARCIVAEAEIALASRDLKFPANKLDAARAALLTRGDLMNAAHARYLELRRLVLIGRIEQAERTLEHFDPEPLPPALRAAHEMIVAGIAMRRVQARKALEHLVLARQAADRAAIPALVAEVENAARILHSPAARLITRGEERLIALDEIETLLASDALVVDACRYVVHHRGGPIPLATRPVLFSLARALAEAWPADLSRDALVKRVFGLKRADESLRARLRVEIGRLRRLLRSAAEITTTARGFALAPPAASEAFVLAPLAEEDHAAVLALLADGESWSSSALALALGSSQRTVQRALDALAASSKVQSIGRGRGQRWMRPPLPGITTTLLLLPTLPSS